MNGTRQQHYEVANALMRGEPDKDILAEYGITKYRLMLIKFENAERELRFLKKDLEDERTESHNLRRQVHQYRDLHNKTRDDLLELGRAANVLLSHPMMEALRVFAEDAGPDYKLPENG